MFTVITDEAEAMNDRDTLESLAMRQDSLLSEHTRFLLRESDKVNESESDKIKRMRELYPNIQIFTNF